MKRGADLYAGQVTHARVGGRAWSFRQKVWMPYVDVRDVVKPSSAGWLWGGPLSPIRFRRRDFLGDPAVPLDAAVRDLVAARLEFRPQGAIRLLAHQRTWGWLFNPIAIYFCHDAADRVVAVVADVVNTPWHERHSYILDAREGLHALAETPKAMHVSPFQPMDLCYRFRIAEMGTTGHIGITAVRDGRPVFVANLSLRRQPLNRRTLGSALLFAPLMTLRVSLGIYGRAVGLALRRKQLYSHPPTSEPSAGSVSHEAS